MDLGTKNIDQVAAKSPRQTLQGALGGLDLTADGIGTMTIITIITMCPLDTIGT